MYKSIAFGFMTIYALCFSADAATATRARAGATQKVVNTGTKVAAATANNLVDSECQDSFFGCMDAFCIVDNVSGGRCQCSNKHAGLMNVLNEIMDMDNQTYAIATYGVEHIEYGKAANDVLSVSEKAFDKAMKDAADESLVDKPATPAKKTALSMDEWNKQFAVDDDDDEEEFSLGADDISNKKGDELYVSAVELCWQQVPQKCQSKEDMMKLLYTQKIKSDCAAFENSLKQQKSESNLKLEEARKQVRTAALKDFKDSNKYSLGQCAIEFKKCMQETAGCGNDFTGCVALAAAENMQNTKSGSVATQVAIHGDLVDTYIASTTMDTLLAKKPMCEHVTEKCVAVSDQVWDVFLKDIAYDVKTAELTAESDLRGNCLGNISECYIKACKENMDPNDPDGSYDMCLSRPDNYKSFCKVQLEPCLAATGGSYEKPDDSSLWRGVLAKLASMRVDACTTEFKACLTDEDRCGADYSQCIGFDNDDVANLCPEDKLTACYSEYNGNTESVRETLKRIAQGVFVNMDNALLAACQKVVDEAMIKVCGDTESCDGLAVDEGMGGRTLELKYCEAVENDKGVEYVNCKDNEDMISDTELGKTTRDVNFGKNKHDIHFFTGIMRGQIAWEYVNSLEDGTGIISYEDYMKSAKNILSMNDAEKQKVQTEIGALSSAIKNAITTIESDPRVQYCMTGRQVQGLKGDKDFVQIIGKSGNAHFPNLTKMNRAMIINSALRRAKENYYAKYDELANDYSEGSYKLAARLAEIQKSNENMDREDVARESCIALGEGDSLGRSLGSNAKKKLNRTSESDGKLVGHSAESSYNYKRSVTTTFNLKEMTCHKCIRTQQCDWTKISYCKEWGPETEKCEDIQF